MTGLPGVWVAVDVGSVRVGVARSDPQGSLALPLVTLRRDTRTDSDVAELAALIREYDAVGVVVGLPRTLRGEEGAAAAAARAYAELLSPRVAPVPVRFLDERLTTVSAQRKLQQSGVRSRAGRAVIDQAAAVELLEHWLDTRRAMLRQAGAVGHDGQQHERADEDEQRPE